MRMGFGRVKEDLLRVGRMLSEAGVEFLYDLSEIRDLPYYTGVVFEVFHPRIGSPLAGGGRYDRLSKVFGSDIPSTGGTVYVDRVVEVLRLRGSP
ncbi:MAG: ATP phosphoribosyltransferase regulatory subunit [Aquificota bacterium]|nr:ATP phosphoribosyltransferase regulatory subunit [Aquificota bacterium]